MIIVEIGKDGGAGGEGEMTLLQVHHHRRIVPVRGGRNQHPGFPIPSHFYSLFYSFLYFL